MNRDFAALKEQLLRDFDLNLLLTFALIYREGSISKAAQCLGVGQPAVSNALNRMRLYFSDPLFRRGYRKMCPTAKAVEIAIAVSAAMESVQQALTCANMPTGTSTAG